MESLSRHNQSLAVDYDLLYSEEDDRKKKSKKFIEAQQERFNQFLKLLRNPRYKYFGGGMFRSDTRTSR